MQPSLGLPTDAQFYSPTDPSKPNLEFLKDHFFHEGRIREDHALWIIHTATALLQREPNVLDIDAPVTGEISLARVFGVRRPASLVLIRSFLLASLR